MFLWVQELPTYTELGTSLASFSKSQAIYPPYGFLGVDSQFMFSGNGQGQHQFVQAEGAILFLKKKTNNKKRGSFLFKVLKIQS